VNQPPNPDSSNQPGPTKKGEQTKNRLAARKGKGVASFTPQGTLTLSNVKHNLPSFIINSFLLDAWHLVMARVG